MPRDLQRRFRRRQASWGGGLNVEVTIHRECCLSRGSWSLTRGHRTDQRTVLAAPTAGRGIHVTVW